jgi:hypothetical protein
MCDVDSFPVCKLTLRISENNCLFLTVHFSHVTEELKSLGTVLNELLFGEIKISEAVKI